MRLRVWGLLAWARRLMMETSLSQLEHKARTTCTVKQAAHLVLVNMTFLFFVSTLLALLLLLFPDDVMWCGVM